MTGYSRPGLRVYPGGVIRYALSSITGGSWAGPAKSGASPTLGGVYQGDQLRAAGMVFPRGDESHFPVDDV